MKHGKGNSTNTGEDKFKQPASRRSSPNKNKNVHQPSTIIGSDLTATIVEKQP